MIEMGRFGFGYRKLERAFGVRENEGRMNTYFEYLEMLIDEKQWGQIVDRIISTAVSFPKISEILAQPECSQRAFLRADDMQRWRNDICRVKECVEGHILIVGGSYNKLYRCPACDRFDSTAAPRYTGVVTLRTEEEMQREKDHRRLVMFDAAYRIEVAGDLVRMLMSICSQPASRNGKPVPALEGVGG